jgi:hypothetical protein
VGNVHRVCGPPVLRNFELILFWGVSEQNALESSFLRSLSLITSRQHKCVAVKRKRKKEDKLSAQN